jgi:hypothetical protein
MTLRSFGTHNLHDDAGVPTFFADVVLFTEAIAPTIIDKARARRATLQARLSGYTIRVCREQRDLVVALRRRHYKVTGVRYERAHPGRAGVTPHRGTFAVETIERATGDRVVFIVEHRINAAFKPWVRGEKVFRQNMWHRHAGISERMIASYVADAWKVRAGGDLNTPRLVHGYGLSVHQGHVVEFGPGLDRLASSDGIRNGEILSRRGSDHPRLRALS